MLLGGGVIAYFGFQAAFHLGGWPGLLPGVFGLLGLVWVFKAAGILIRWGHLAIIIDERGIEIPAGRAANGAFLRSLIKREDITWISKHESLKGRLIDIGTRTGESIHVQARHYCELDEFIDHCRAHQLPAAGQRSL